MDAASTGVVEGMTRGELGEDFPSQVVAASDEALVEEMNKIEADVRRRLPIGWSTSYASLVREFVTQQGYTSQ